MCRGAIFWATHAEAKSASHVGRHEPVRDHEPTPTEFGDGGSRHGEAGHPLDMDTRTPPTGHRWPVLDQLAAERGLPLVCVQPLLVSRVREAEDQTWDKSDLKDAMLIVGCVGGRAALLGSRTHRRHLGATSDGTSIHKR